MIAPGVNPLRVVATSQTKLDRFRKKPGCHARCALAIRKIEQPLAHCTKSFWLIDKFTQFSRPVGCLYYAGITQMQAGTGQSQVQTELALIVCESDCYARQPQRSALPGHGAARSHENICTCHGFSHRRDALTQFKLSNGPSVLLGILTDALTITLLQGGPMRIRGADNHFCLNT